MVTKTPYYNDELPTLRFPWALKVSDFEKILLVSGHADVKHDNSSANFPGDLICQTKFILKQIEKSVAAAVKPAAGTMRFVERLISRECLVEIKVMLAT